MIQNHERVLCWDFDETVGRFRLPLNAPELKGLPRHERTRASREHPTQIRPQIHQVLSELQRKGFRHMLTSLAESEYLQQKLASASLTPYFEHIFRRNQIVRDATFGKGKLYRCVTDYLGLTPEQASTSMLIIGDHPADKPLDLAQVVFFHCRDGYKYDARLTTDVINHLLQKGSGSFNQGFQGLYQEANPKSSTRVVNLSHDIRVNLYYDISHGTNVPTITNVHAPSYEQKAA